eukprot:4604910-Prymnesium_polylepis.1
MGSSFWQGRSTRWREPFRTATCSQSSATSEPMLSALITAVMLPSASSTKRAVCASAFGIEMRHSCCGGSPPVVES